MVVAMSRVVRGCPGNMAGNMDEVGDGRYFEFNSGGWHTNALKVNA